MAQQSSKQIAGTGANDSSVGTVSWTSPTAISADDSNPAAANTLSNGDQSYYLKATNFGFNIPSDSVILGIFVEANAMDPTDFDDLRDESVRLVKGGSIQGDDKAAGNALPVQALSGTNIESWGGSSDLWGTPLDPSDVNASDFGVVISYQSYSSLGSPNIDAIWITVYYDTPGRGFAEFF